MTIDAETLEKMRDGLLARRCAERLDAGIHGPQPIHGMTSKQYDHYLHLRITFSRVLARQLAMSGS